MTIELKLSSLPESVSEATVLEWTKQPGDSIKQDEKLVEIETDKVLLEIPSPCDGTLTEIIAKEGSIIESDALLALIEASEISDNNIEPNNISEDKVSNTEKDIILSPAVTHLLSQHKLNAADIVPTGKRGQLLKKDILDHIKNIEASVQQPSNSNMNKSATQSQAVKQTHEKISQPTPTNTAEDVQQHSMNTESTTIDTNDLQRETRTPMTRIRARIAERLVEAQQTTAMLTTFNEADMTAIINLRKQHGDAFLQRHDVKLGFMSFFVKAVSNALQQFPVINASIEGSDIIYHNFYDIGIAVGSKRGLVVPILRSADQMGFAEVEQSIVTFAQQSRNGTISIDDITGGTFTITNGGVFGSLLSTPILNPPQSAILGLHSIKKRPIAVEVDGKDEIAIRPMMNLALSYDHRIIDGSEAVQFLVAVKSKIEDPISLMIQV